LCGLRGAASVKFTFSADGQIHRLRLAEATRSFFPKDTIVSGYKIEFLALEPNYNTKFPPVPADQIKAEMKITKQ